MCKKLIYLTSFVLVLGVTAGVTSADLVAYWPFDEGTGDVAYDAIGDNDGQITGCTWVMPGKVGAAAIEGSGGNEVNCGAGPTPTTEDLTLAWWMVDNHDNYGTIMDKSVTGSGYGYNILVRHHTNEDSPLRFRIGGWQSYGGWGEECRVPQGAYSDGVWVHVVCTYDSATDTATIYIDGEVAENGNYNPKTGIAGPTGYCDGVNNPDTPLYIRGGEESFNGILDEVAIWDSALTAEEVLDVYTLGVLALDPRQAGSPNPADEELDVSRKPVLSWTPGIYADKHDIYFGADFNDVNDASNLDPMGPDKVYRARQDANSYTVPETLDFGQTYYWRIDEVNAPPYTNTIFEGKVWQFTVEPFAYPIDGNNIVATASSSDADQGPENTVNRSGLDADDLHSTEMTDMWLSGEESAGQAWIEYEFDKVYKLHQMWVWNHNTVFEAWVGFGFKDVTVEYSTDGTNWTELGDVPEFARALGQDAYEHDTTVDFRGAVVKYVKLAVNSNWGGYDQSGLSEVRFLHIPTWARYPNPRDGATGVGPDVVLSWRAGREAAEHNVYVSTKRQAVINGTAPVTNIPVAGECPASHDAGTLELGKTYYWKIDEVNEAETPTTWDGNVWSFATPEYFVVDDFEDYNDFEPDRIFETWKGGYGYTGYCGNGTGSAVGHASYPYAEQTIVHEGRQSMPVYYDNSGTGTNSCGQPINLYYSETERTFDTPQDWTRAGVRALTLYFQGEPDNDAGATEQMYLKVNGAKVVYDGDMADIKEASWHEWNIDLASFAGVNLQNVTKISIGFGNEGSATPGGGGTVYFDDVRLYPSRCVLSRRSDDFARVDYVEDCVVNYNELETMSVDWLGTGYQITPANPGTANLVAHYPFNGNANDVVGGHNGTTSGLVTYGPGKVGQAILLDGVDDLVTVGPVGISGAAARTIAGWAKSNVISMPDWINIFGFTGPSGGNGHFDIEHVNVGGNRGYGIHVYGWERVIFPVDLEWHHLAASYDGTTISWYGDGRLIGSDSSRTLDTPDNVHMGKRDDNDNYFAGCLDEVYIYGRVLSEAEIAWLAGHTSPLSIPPDLYLDGTLDFKDFAELAAWWLDEQLWPWP